MNDEIKIVIGGDVFPTSINYDLFSDCNVDKLFGKRIVELFQTADYTVCNLEGCFTGGKTTPKDKDGPNISAPIKCANAIKELGINCVSLANNHVTDYGLIGFDDTCKTLMKHGIRFFGAGENENNIITHHTIEADGLKITFYGVGETLENKPSDVLPGINIYDEFRVCKEIKELKNNCDYLIVLYHGGIENFHYNTKSIRTRFCRMADNGADIVISQHTHAIGEEEYYHGSYFLYGQGNFCFHFSKKLPEWVINGIVLELAMRKDGFIVKKHLIRREDDHIVYVENPNFSEFDERSNRLIGGDSFENEFSEYADNRILTYLATFRGTNNIDRIVRKILSSEKYSRYIRRKYKKKHLLKILLLLESEEFREVVTKGLHNMLDELIE